VHLRLPGAPPLPYGDVNDVWCVDFKGQFNVGDGVRCYPLTLTEGVSRYLLKCEGLAQPREAPVRTQLELAFREFGLPLRMRSDNGPPFATMSVGGVSSLAVWWVKLGIIPERIEVGHPEQNGRHERMHRTLKAETASPPAANMIEQQRAFDRFRHEYNDIRPHEALDQKPPAKHFTSSTRRYPATLKSPEYEDCAVRYVGGNGVVSFRGKNLRISDILAREPVGFVQVDTSRFEVRYGPMRLGIVDERDGELRFVSGRRDKKKNHTAVLDVENTDAATIGSVHDDDGPGLCEQPNRSVEPGLPVPVDEDLG
jgi:hypothetical protein